jgi:phosphate transport system substrate-binding protein
MNTKKICKRLVKDAQAVSPIIATLMLVLVAVGSAGAFYAWQTGWQKDNTESMSDFNTKSNLLIGGSSTVYEFTAIAAPLFEEVSDIKVSYQAGGSGSGVIGVGEGVVDIGSASRYVKSTEYEDYPDLIEHTVAYDAIVMIVSDDNVHANNTQLTITEIQAVYHINGGVALLDCPADVQTWAGAVPPSSPFIYNATDHEVQWTDGTLVNIYERADHSGTEDVFCHKLLRGDEAQLDEQDPAINCPAGNKITGNAALLTTLAGDPDGLSFMSFGAAKESNDVEMLNIDFGNGYIKPTETNIKKPVGDPEKYESYRPINYITLGEPTGYAKMYLEFVRGTMMNQDIADECGYMSIY